VAQGADGGKLRQPRAPSNGYERRAAAPYAVALVRGTAEPTSKPITHGRPRRPTRWPSRLARRSQPRGPSPSTRSTALGDGLHPRARDTPPTDAHRSGCAQLSRIRCAITLTSTSEAALGGALRRHYTHTPGIGERRNHSQRLTPAARIASASGFLASMAAADAQRDVRATVPPRPSMWRPASNNRSGG